MALDDQGNYYPSIMDKITPELLDLIKKEYENADFLYNGKFNRSIPYLFYVNENNNLKYIKLEQYTEGEYYQTVFFCQFKEPAFVLGISIDGRETRFPSHNCLTPKEIAFSSFPYFKETWIETEDMRKVDSYFVTVGINFRPY